MRWMCVVAAIALSPGIARAQSAPAPADGAIPPEQTATPALGVATPDHVEDASVIDARAPLATALEAPPTRRANLGRLYLAGIVGELIGAAIGTLLTLPGLAAIGCHNGEGWISGFTCLAGYGYGMSAFGVLGASVGSALSIQRTGDSRGMGGNPFANLVATLGGYALGALVATIGAAATDEITIAFGLGAAVSALTSPLFGALAYDDTQAPADDAPTVAVLPFFGLAGPSGGQVGVVGGW